MKNRFFKNILLLSSVFLLTATSSCTNLLEDESKDALVIDEATLSDINNLDRVLLNSYQTMPVGSDAFIQSMMTDEVRIAPSNNGSGVFLWSRAITSQDSNIQALWNSLYRTIFTANKVLDNIDKVTNDGANGLSKNQIKAEALGMRAFGHFLVLKDFSPKYNPTALGCAYVTTGAIENLYDIPARDNMQVSYQKVLADLDAAIALNPSNTLNKRMSLSALRALKALVYLEIGDYANSVTFATQSLTGKSLKTTAADIANLWIDPISGAGSNSSAVDGSEVIFQQINIAGSVNTTMGGNYRSPSLGFFWYVANTSFSKYASTDFRVNSYFKTSSGNLIHYKYYGPSATPGVANIKIIRTAEMMLVRAEARAKSGDLAGAFTDYAAVRTARNAGASVAFTSLQDAVDKILDEKARECILEGKRLTDLKRNNKTVVRLSSDATTAYPNTSFPDVQKMTLPIPYSEIFANPNMVQNPSW
ncbi:MULTISPECIES: RagB/SusD family nutrient uptake outer membrane protein [unclassified Chryseobacterium]|uniref:RagB/SusD family nutrient uptake outer membrane protein n=1 Tax=unclassified Chryseobacterium TaxID=2593645 RepID=UPI00301685BE